MDILRHVYIRLSPKTSKCVVCFVCNKGLFEPICLVSHFYSLFFLIHHREQCRLTLPSWIITKYIFVVSNVFTQRKSLKYLFFCYLSKVLFVYGRFGQIVFDFQYLVSYLNRQTFFQTSHCSSNPYGFKINVYQCLPYSKSSKQVWQTFFNLLHVWQISVFLYLIPAPGHHLNVVNGRWHILHSCPYLSFI